MSITNKFSCPKCSGTWTYAPGEQCYECKGVGRMAEVLEDGTVEFWNVSFAPGCKVVFRSTSGKEDFGIFEWAVGWPRIDFLHKIIAKISSERSGASNHRNMSNISKAYGR